MKMLPDVGFYLPFNQAFSRPHEHFIRLYNAYVRSRLEYCCTVWNPQYAKYVDKIERVQKKFTRMLYFKFKWTKPEYPTRLNELNMTSLETRRIQLDEMMLFSIIHQRTETTMISDIHFNNSSRFARNQPLFYLPTKYNVNNTNMQRNSPMNV